MSTQSSWEAEAGARWTSHSLQQKTGDSDPSWGSAANRVQAGRPGDGPRFSEAPTGQTAPAPPSAGSTSVASAALCLSCTDLRISHLFSLCLLVPLGRVFGPRQRVRPVLPSCSLRGCEHLLFLLPQSIVPRGCQGHSWRALSCPDE